MPSMSADDYVEALARGDFHSSNTDEAKAAQPAAAQPADAPPEAPAPPPVAPAPETQEA